MAMLEAFDLYRFYHAGEEETLALRGISMHLDAGELVVVTGPSGSGKSTLLNCLAGLDEPDGGHVELLGQRLTRRPEADRAKMRAHCIGSLMQAGNLFEQFNVEDNILLAMRLSGKVERPRIGELLAQVGLSARAHARPSRLSGGELARAGLAVALAADPPVLLADEPTGEVDRDTEGDVLRLLRARVSDGGAVLVVTHSQPLAAEADRVLHLRDGQVANG